MVNKPKLNMELMKKKLERLNAPKGKKGDGEESVFWRPSTLVPEKEGVGKADIRIVPTEDGDCFREVHQHNLRWKDPKTGYTRFRSVICLQRNFNEDCPICEFASNLWKQYTETNNEEDKEQAKALFAKERYYSPVVVRGEEEKGVKLWGYGNRVYKQFIELVTNEEYGDITDVDEGLDLSLKYTKKSDGSLPETTLTPKRKESPLTKTKKALEELLSNVPSIDEHACKKPTKEEVMDVFNEFLGTTDDGVGDEKYGGETATSGDETDSPVSPDEAIKELNGENDIPF